MGNLNCISESGQKTLQFSQKKTISLKNEDNDDNVIMATGEKEQFLLAKENIKGDIFVSFYKRLKICISALTAVSQLLR